ncbi:hypothetical protein GQ600_24541 [Phytophthora cactorum]|nr:hypothetical protein GQ600_24541 [Phytophthora cactorum]
MEIQHTPAAKCVPDAQATDWILPGWAVIYACDLGRTNDSLVFWEQGMTSVAAVLVQESKMNSEIAFRLFLALSEKYRLDVSIVLT